MSKIHSKIQIPVALASKGGVLEAFVWDNMIRGHKPTFSEDVVTLNGINPNEQPSFVDLIEIVAGGGSFEGIKLGLRFASGTTANRIVPIGIRGATYTDEEGVEQGRTWIEWFRANSTVQVITDGTSYVAKAVFNGELLDSDELYLANGQSGVSVLEWEAVKALYQNESWTEYEL